MLLSEATGLQPLHFMQVVVLAGGVEINSVEITVEMMVVNIVIITVTVNYETESVSVVITAIAQIFWLQIDQPQSVNDCKDLGNWGNNDNRQNNINNNHGGNGNNDGPKKNGNWNRGSGNQNQGNGNWNHKIARRRTPVKTEMHLMVIMVQMMKHIAHHTCFKQWQAVL